MDEAWGGEVERVLAPSGGGGPAEAKRQLVQALANRIAYGISRAVTVTPVGLVAAALLSHVRRGLTAADVARRVELLRYVGAEGGARFARDLAGAPSDPRAAGPIRDAVRRLAAGGLLRVDEAAGDTIYQVVDEKRPVLDYHRNAVIHRYVAPALVAAAARTAGPGAPASAVRERALWLSRLFKLEFMYRVGSTFDAIFEEYAAFLARLGALARDGDRLAPGPEPWTLAFLAEFLRAYLEAYRLTADTALALLPAAGRSTAAPSCGRRSSAAGRRSCPAASRCASRSRRPRWRTPSSGSWRRGSSPRTAIASRSATPRRFARSWTASLRISRRDAPRRARARAPANLDGIAPQPRALIVWSCLFHRHPDPR